MLVAAAICCSVGATGTGSIAPAGARPKLRRLRIALAVSAKLEDKKGVRSIVSVTRSTPRFTAVFAGVLVVEGTVVDTGRNRGVGTFRAALYWL